MASQATKVRLVRCPRCLKLLPELANLPVYQCGGCGTTLKAKKKKENQECDISQALAQNSPQNKEPGHDYENEELKCSSRKTTMCSTDTCEEREHQDCDKEKSRSGQIANGYSSSGELKWHEEKGLSSVVGGTSIVDGNSERGSDLENTSPDTQEIAGHGKFTSASQKPCDESIPSNKNASPLSEDLDISEKIVRRYANLIGSRSPMQTPGATGSKIASEAKKKKEDQEGEISQALAQNSPQNKEPVHDYENEELKCSTQKTTMRSTDTCEEHEHRDCDKEKFGSGQIANGYSSSGELKWHEEKGLSSVGGGTSIADGNSERGSDLENTSPGTQEIAGHGKFTSTSQKPCDESIPSNKNASPLSEDLDISEKIIRRYANLIGSRSPVQTPGSTGSKIASEGDMVGNKLKGGLVVSEPPEAKINHVYDDKSLVQTPAVTNSKIFPEENMVGNKHGGGLVASETLEAKINHAYYDISLVQTPTATDSKIFSKNNMVGNKLRDGLVVSKPLEAKINHAYDGSVSSNDGWCDQASDFDQVADLHLNQYKKSYSGSQRVEEVISTGEGPTAEDISANNNIDSKVEVQNQSSNFSLIPVTQAYGPVVEDNISPDRDESTENTKYGFQVHKQVTSHGSTSLTPVQSWVGVNKEELKTEKPLGQRDYAAEYENSGPSEYNHHEFLSPSLYEPKKLESVERNQMELMRKVDELRYQLNKSYSHRRKAKEGFAITGNQQERQCPLYYAQSQPEQEVLQRCDVTFPRQYPRTYRPSKSMPFQPQMPVSGNVVNCRHYSNCPCSKPYSEDWQSLQLRPPNFYNEGPCIAYPGQVCYSLYSSIPSSPEQHLHSRLPLHSREVCMLPPDQIDRDHYVEKLQHRERRQPVKRHCRPIAGGARL